MTLHAKRSGMVWQSLGLACLVVIALPFALYAIQKGLQFATPAERETSRLFDASAIWSSALIYIHMVSGGVITVLAPLQMSRAVRVRWPKLHHISGYSIAGLAMLTAIAGLFYIAQQGTIGGAVMSLGFSIYGVLTTVTAVQTVRYARQRCSLHRLWAGRLIILALASWLYRVHYGLWEILTGGAASNDDFSGLFDQIQVFAFYLPYLLVHQLWWSLWAHRGAFR